MKAIKQYTSRNLSAPLLIIILMVTGAKCLINYTTLCLETGETYSVDLESNQTPKFKSTKSDLHRKFEHIGYELYYNPVFFENHDGKALAEIKIELPQRDMLVGIEQDLKKYGLGVLFDGECSEVCTWSEWFPCKWVDHPGGQCLCRYTKQCVQQKGILEQEVKNCTDNTSTTHKTEKILTTPPTSTCNCDQDNNSITHKNFSKTENSSTIPETDTNNTDQNCIAPKDPGYSQVDFLSNCITCVVTAFIAIISTACVCRAKYKKREGEPESNDNAYRATPETFEQEPINLYVDIKFTTDPMQVSPDGRS